MAEIVFEDLSKKGRRQPKIKRKPSKIPSIYMQTFRQEKYKGGENRDYPFVPTRITLKKPLDTSKLALQWANSPTEKVLW